MRVLLSVTATVATLLSAAVLPDLASAQTKRDHAWCFEDATDDQTIKGCTALLARPGQFSQSRLASIYAIRGDAYSVKRDFRRAIADYTEALRLEPNPRRYNNRGRAYQRDRQYDLAIADYTEAIKLDPNYALAYFNRGDTYDDKGDKPRALEDIGAALRINPKMAQAYFLRAYIYRSMKDRERALADYNEAIRLEPKNTRYIEGRDEFLHLGEMEAHWVRYLTEIQNDNDYANWSGPPLDAHRAAKK